MVCQSGADIVNTEPVDLWIIVQNWIFFQPAAFVYRRAVASNFCRTTHDLDTMVCKNNTSCDWLPPFDGNYI